MAQDYPTNGNGMGVSEQALKDSMQRFPETASGGVASMFYVPNQPDILPRWGLRIRDQHLRWFLVKTNNTLVQGTINLFSQIVQATPWEISGKDTNEPEDDPEYFQQLFMSADFGGGFDVMIGKFVQDFLTQDFGGVIEIIGRGDPATPLTTAPTGLAHLDSYRCWATGKPEYPIIYQSSWGGEWHQVHWTRIARMVDMPSSDERVYNLGLCALSRAIGIANVQILMGQYQNERMNDLPPAGLLKLSNVPKGYWNTIKKMYDSDRVRDGSNIWSNIIEIEGVQSDKEVQVEFLSFSQLPEAFNYREYMEVHVNALALAFGVDPQDIWPLTGAPLGTGTQSKILASKARGKGYGYVLKRLERLINICILPKSLEFKFKYKDEEQDRENADIAKLWMDIANSASVMSEIEKRRLLADNVEAFADILLDPNGELIELPDDDPKSAEDEIIVEDFTPLDTSAAPAGEQGAITFGESKVLKRRRITDATRIGSEIRKRPRMDVDLGGLGDANRDKAIQATRLDFEADWADMIEAAETGSIERRRFGTVARAHLRNYGQKAYKDGLEDGGVEDDLSSDDLSAVADILAEQSGYVSDFADSLYGDEAIEPDPEGKATVWFKKSIQPFYQAGLTAADANGMYEWVYGDTEHCDDCQRLNGQKHRLREWLDSGWEPQGDELECHGFNCKCALVKTSGRSRGSY